MWMDILSLKWQTLFGRENLVSCVQWKSELKYSKISDNYVVVTSVVWVSVPL